MKMSIQQIEMIKLTKLSIRKLAKRLDRVIQLREYRNKIIMPLGMLPQIMLIYYGTPLIPSSSSIHSFNHSHLRRINVYAQNNSKLLKIRENDKFVKDNRIKLTCQQLQRGGNFFIMNSCLIIENFEEIFSHQTNKSKRGKHECTRIGMTAMEKKKKIGRETTGA